MKVSKLHSYPNHDLLSEIISGKQLKAASPFYSSASLQLINPKKLNGMSFITRLPTQYIMPSAFIENDPSPLVKLLGKMGARMKIYALPELHAKLYINEKSTWVGSSNFTMNGFSGKQEILIQFDDNEASWSKVFDTYMEDSVEVGQSDLEKLSHWISLGLTKIRSQHHTANETPGNEAKTPLTFEDFIEWLGEPKQPHAPIRKHIHDRVKGKNYMSGHVPPAFNGAMSFLRLNSKHIPTLEKAKDNSIPYAVLEDFASFVRKYGDHYRGSKGGYWRNYLSTKLGGAQDTGGAGDTVAKKCLVLVPAYIKARLQPQFG